jgi:hypothetical protein
VHWFNKLLPCQFIFFGEGKGEPGKKRRKMEIYPKKFPSRPDEAARRGYRRVKD